jgi:hypothetical protein
MLWVGIRDSRLQVRSTEDEYGAVHTFSFEEYLDAGNLNLTEQRDKLAIPVGRDATGSPIGHFSLLVDRREIDPSRQIGRAQRKSDPQRRQHATTNVTRDRVVAK